MRKGKARIVITPGLRLALRPGISPSKAAASHNYESMVAICNAYKLRNSYTVQELYGIIPNHRNPDGTCSPKPMIRYLVNDLEWLILFRDEVRSGWSGSERAPQRSTPPNAQQISNSPKSPPRDYPLSKDVPLQAQKSKKLRNPSLIWSVATLFVVLVLVLVIRASR